VIRTATRENPLLLWIGPSQAPTSSGWRVATTSSGSDALHLLDQPVARFRPHVIVMELPVAEATAVELLEDLRASSGVPVLVAGADVSVAEAVRLMRLGAHEVVLYSGAATAIERAIEWQNARMDAAEIRDEPWRRLLVGSSAALQRTLEVVRLVGERRSTVLITGETGTGKEMVARALHLASPRASLPWVAVNCNALPDNLLEAELFGHVKGAFTGAIQGRVGRFEQAHKGTLFLDEVGNLPLDFQTKLLRVLQEREFQRIGSSETVRVDVRIVAATNVKLVEKVQEGEFREDLYYRLNVVPISMPPLRDRLEDVPVLATHFAAKVCRMECIPERQISPEAVERLMSYSWPGNVRQLENAVEMAVALSGERERLHPSDFPLGANGHRIPPRASSEIAVPVEGFDFEETVGRIERQILSEALKRSNGNKTAAAEMLGLKRTTLSAKLKTLDAVAAA
jgi:DNA-binding NtrC family response regulator